jgi:hypothetical protein
VQNTEAPYIHGARRGVSSLNPLAGVQSLRSIAEE